MRFKEVAFTVQMPHLALSKEAEQIKGSALSEDEERALAERAQYAKFWLSTYAPEEFKYELQQQMPIVELSPIQKKALAALEAYLKEGNRSGEELHLKLHEFKTEIPIQPKELFQAIYRIFLNRDSGPKAGSFLAGLPQDFVIARLKEEASV
jgi:lysyl-tRNA synthetase class 1